MSDAASAFSNQDVVADFNTIQGDSLNIANLLVGFDPVQSAINDFVTFTTVGRDTVMAVDRDGADTTYNSANVVTMTGVIGLDADDLLAQGNLTVV